MIEEIKSISGQDVSLCYQCGECSSSCQASGINGFYPSVLIHRIKLKDPTVLDEKAFEVCLHCFLCTVRCPQGISFPDVTTALSNIWVKKHGPDRIERAFLKELREKGFINPVKVALSALGLDSIKSLSPRAVKLMKVSSRSGKVREDLLREVREIVP